MDEVLSLDDLVETDAGAYQCRAYNDYNAAFSQTAQVYVIGSKVI